MPQGKMKKKVQLPAGAKQKQGRPKNQGQAKKGGGFIAPKKAKHVQAAQMKKNLEKAINAHIEEEISARAAKSEPKPLYMLKTEKPKKESSKK